MGTWQQVQTDTNSEVPAGRGGAACVAIGGRRLLLFGGANRTPLSFNDWWLLELTGDCSGGHWTKISPVVKLTKKRKLLPRSGSSLTYIPAGNGFGRVYIFGGQDPVAGAIFADLLCLDTSSWELTDVALAPEDAPLPELSKQQQRQQGQEPPAQQLQRPPARHSHVAGAYEQSGILVFGGAGLRGPLNDVWLFQEATATWRCLSAALPADECPEGREMAAGTMISEAGLLVHGGRGADGALLHDIAIFDGRAARWVLIQATKFPRCAHTACNAAAAPLPAPGGAAGAGGDAQAAAAANGAAAAHGGTAGGSPASNMLLYGGFDGTAVVGDVLQLTFLRSCRDELLAELRPVTGTGSKVPPPRFAHASAVLPGPQATEVVVLGGVNETQDLSDAWRLV